MRSLVSRFVQLVGVLIAVSLLTFLLLSALPGNQVLYRIGILTNFTPTQRAEVIARMTRELGLDKPLPVQYGIWLERAVQGKFGLSVQGEPVGQLVVSRVWATIELGAAGVSLGALIALLLAVWTYRSRSRTVRAVVHAVMSTLLVAPAFWLGFLLVLAFAVRSTLVPASGYVPLGQSVAGNIRHLVLPALTLALPLAALLFRYLYDGLEEAGEGAYVVTARSTGISDRKVMYRHILPNGLLPTVTILGMVTASLMSSLVIIESVFAWPGLGSLLVESVNDRDFNTLVAIVLLTATAFVVTSLIVDVLYYVIDPRTRRPQVV
jgi:peptide/nickel transport system permease protein